MTDNPYAPPAARVVDASRPMATGRFSLRACVADASHVTLWRVGVWLPALALMGLAMLLCTASLFGLILIAPVLFWGYNRLCLNLHDDRGSLLDLFSGFSDYGRALFGYVAVWTALCVFAFAGGSVNTIARGAQTATLSWITFLATALWFAAVVSRFSFAWYFVVDRALGPVESLAAAWDVTRGQTLRIAALTLLSGLLLALGALAAGIGLLPATAMVAGMWASAYRQTTSTCAVARDSDSLSIGLTRSTT